MIDHPEHGPILDADDMSVLLGVPAADITTCIRAQLLGTGKQESSVLPQEWLERGRSRSDIYRQAAGRDDMAGALEFWKAQRTETGQ